MCPACNGFNPHGLNEPPPETCRHCGAVFVLERCGWARKVEPRHLGPDDLADMRCGAFAPCGVGAVACGSADRQGRCEAHVGLAVGEEPGTNDANKELKEIP